MICEVGSTILWVNGDSGFGSVPCTLKLVSAGHMVSHMNIFRSSIRSSSKDVVGLALDTSTSLDPSDAIGRLLVRALILTPLAAPLLLSYPDSAGPLLGATIGSIAGVIALVLKYKRERQRREDSISIVFTQKPLTRDIREWENRG